MAVIVYKKEVCELLKSLKKVNNLAFLTPLYFESVIWVPKQAQTQTVERRQVPRVTLRRIITCQMGVLLDRQMMLAGKRLSGSLVNISNGGYVLRRGTA